MWPPPSLQFWKTDNTCIWRHGKIYISLFFEEIFGRQNEEKKTEIVSALHHHSDLNQSIMQPRERGEGGRKNNCNCFTWTWVLLQHNLRSIPFNNISKIIIFVPPHPLLFLWPQFEKLLNVTERQLLLWKQKTAENSKNSSTVIPSFLFVMPHIMNWNTLTISLNLVFNLRRRKKGDVCRRHV